MQFLLDTNVVIPAEPTSRGDVEPTTPAIADLIQLLNRGTHTTYVHPASFRELQDDKDHQRREVRSLLLRKYTELPEPPELRSRLVAVLGRPRARSNHETDMLLLSAVDANAVDYLVTEDEGIHRRARRVGLEDRVLTVADAIVSVRALFPTIPTAPPLVTSMLAHQLNEADPIFTSFRASYAPFDDWLAKCKREHRRTWVIRMTGDYAGVCIVANQSPNDYGIAGKVLKICSFKIGDQFRGNRYGELLLKALFGYLTENAYHAAFVEVFPDQQELLSFLAAFGFDDRFESTKRERVLVKAFAPPPGAARQFSALDFHIRFGPLNIKADSARIFVVPIQPRYHRLLFPELEPQQSLLTESYPFGNSIRKAYLSRSKIRRIAAGDILLFYRSGDLRAVTTTGIAEDTLVSQDASALARFVGKRTVYSYKQIEEMAQKDVLAIRFRQARSLNVPWEFDQLRKLGIMKRAPQSIMEVSGQGADWIATQLGARS